MICAKIKLTVGSTTYMPGDTITKKLIEPDKRFLLQEGYIEEKEEAAGGKTSKKTASSDKPEKQG